MLWARTASLLLLLVAGAAPAAPPARIVSLNPSLTAILLELGAGDALVGVDEVSARQQPAVADLPIVGGLFNPGLEAVLAVEPELVVVVPSARQRDLHNRLRGLGIEVLELPNIELEQLLVSIGTLGRVVEREEAARRRVAAIRRAFENARRESRQRPRLRTAMVIQRDPLYVVGGGSFLDAMLGAAGADNVAAEFPEPYPRVELEWMIEAAPQVILDASEDPEQDAARYWSRWPSLPAVAGGRVVPISGVDVMLPGPRVDRGLELLVQALRGTETLP